MCRSIQRLCLAIICLVAGSPLLLAQSTSITVTPTTQTICVPNSATMTATLPASLSGTAWTTAPDDGYTGVIPLGFNFTFFGNTYNSCLVSSNNYITFDLTNAGGYSPWSIPAAIPTSSDPMNSIMCPWQDLYPPGGGTITYATLGSAPNRKFVVAYCSVAMFSCTTLLFTSEIILYEGTNIIETHIANKPLCATWNGGNAIHGIQNSTGTIAYVVPGRNFPTQWTAANDGYRWTPTGPSTYNVGAIPYAPVILSSTTGPIQWYVGATLVGTGPTLTVTPTTTTTYTATVSGGCIGASSATATVVVGSLAATSTSTNVTCFGGCNGTGTVTPTGGTAPYTYAWSPSGGTGATASGLCAGTYTCVVQDASGCSSNQVITITQPPALAVTFTQTNVTCNAACNGSATVTPSGGTGAYTYSWSPSGGTAATASSLCAGTYTCTVHDANNCVITQVVTITQPTALAVTSTQTNVTCNAACNGTATVTVTGGTGAYTYSWSPSGGTAATASSLCAGTYTCTIHDANNCVITKVVTITQPAALATTFTQTNVTCNAACNGSSTVTVTGGTPPYNYSWSPSGGTGATASSLCAGTYTCTVTDANSCVITQVVTITQPTALAVTFIQSNVTCNAACNGSSTVTLTGGTPPYTYSWSPSGGTGATASSLCAGTYTCTMHDANNCVITQVVTITQPTALAVTFTQTNVTCNAACNGTATVNVTGGTGTYTYSWTPSGGTGSTATSLCAGTYTCTIHDANNCLITQVVTITQPTPLTATATATGSTCGNSNGSIICNPTGGTPGPGYIYSWNTIPAQTTQTATALAAGTYNCTVTDANGCTFTVTATVTNSGGPTVTLGTVTNVTCNALCNGSATVNASGGTGTLTYAWTTAPVQITPTATGLCAGTYNCTVTDANGCSQTVTAVITQPAALTASISASSNVLCFGGNTGSATVTASGGTVLYTYSWNTVPAQTSATATGLSVGSYNCTVTDHNGCTTTVSVTITQPTALAITNMQTNVSCNGGNDGTATVTVTGGAGGYGYSWNTSPAQLTQTATGLPVGTYVCTATDANGCTITSSVTITQPTALSLTMSQVSAHCNKSDGRASVTVTGGTGAPTYVWSPAPSVSGQGTASANGFMPGIVTVTVTDGNGCVATGTITIQNVPGVSLSIPTSTNVTCFGGSNGSATAVPAGGSAPFTYSWSGNPSTTSTASSLAFGSYTCTVTDSAGCLATATVNITQPAQMVVQPMAHVTICLSTCTPLTATTTGGNGTYTYSWTNNATPVTSPVCPTTTTTYTVVSIDGNGCTSAPSTTMVIVNPNLNVVATGTASVCPGASTALNATGSGGGGTYSYSWIPATGLSSTTVANPTATPASTTTYTVILNDNCGSPADSATVTVTVYPTPVPTITTTDSAGCAPVTITFNGSSNPGCATAAWQFGDGGLASGCGPQTHTYSTPGTYNVTLNVVDIHGCPGSVVKSNWINIYPVPVAAFVGSPQPTTIVNPLITFTNQSMGASTYLWNFGDLSNASSTLASPTYSYADTGCYQVTLIVKNSFGCSDTATGPICIKPDYTFFAPNAFSPNGDGLNDVFMPKGTGVQPSQFKFFIFDRWGNLIWSTSTWGEGWDGRANNGSDIAQNDTYVWRIELTNYQGTKEVYTGMVNLIK